MKIHLKVFKVVLTCKYCPYPASTKIQREEQERIKRVLDEQDNWNAELEKIMKGNDLRRKELNKNETLTERDKQKLEEEKKKVIVFTSSHPHMLSCWILRCFLL